MATLRVDVHAHGAEVPVTIEAVLSGAERWTVVDGDCLSVMAGMPDGCVDHVVTDPPYEAQAHTKARRVCRDGAIGVLAIDFGPIDSITRKVAAQQINRIATGWALAFCQVEAVQFWASEFSEAYRRTMIWVKPDAAPQFTGDRPGMGYECIAVAWCGSGRSRWNGGGRRGVLTHTVNTSGTRNEHPTTKPLPLMLELVSLFTDPGDLILDPFCGSGTTLVAALRLGRRAIGIEREPKWAQLSRERCEAEMCNSTLQAQRAGQGVLFG